MLTYIFQALHTFRKVFSRCATWLACCIVVPGGAVVYMRCSDTAQRPYNVSCSYVLMPLKLMPSTR
jgi:hypothetical protein